MAARHTARQLPPALQAKCADTSEYIDDVPVMLAAGRASVGDHPRDSVVQFGGLIEKTAAH
jgi:hypothetical protein